MTINLRATVIGLIGTICHFCPSFAQQVDNYDKTKILSKNITDILNSLVNKEHYDKRLRPNYGGNPVSVGVTIHVSSISAVSEVAMDYTLDMYLREMWNDRRLKFHPPAGVSELTIDVEYLKSIWVPDTFFPNEKKSFFHIATTHNSFLRITPQGNITTSQRFLFIRSIGFYMIQIYLPSILIVIISWVSFWLSRDATPARVSLGVTTVLTMTTLMTTTNAAMPKVSYIKSIDIYLGTCFLMVFASLLEYAAVGYLNKRLRMQKEKRSKNATHNHSTLDAAMLKPVPMHLASQPNQSPYRPLLAGTDHYPPPYLSPADTRLPIQPVECDCDLEKPLFKSLIKRPLPKKNIGVTPSGIDKYSRVVFPVTFLAFNALYWSIYWNIGQGKLAPQ